ncbi:MAG TPA: hypothetical protein VH987_06175 [Candidatus Limnocylindria bacterium]|jgi:hypothetical protein
MPWLFLLGAIACGAAAYRIGWPAWTSFRQREARDLNAERYLAWRGRAVSPGSASLREGPTNVERRALVLAAILAVASVALLVGFFATT